MFGSAETPAISSNSLHQFHSSGWMTCVYIYIYCWCLNTRCGSLMSGVSAYILADSQYHIPLWEQFLFLMHLKQGSSLPDRCWLAHSNHRNHMLSFLYLALRWLHSTIFFFSFFFLPPEKDMTLNITCEIYASFLSTNLCKWIPADTVWRMHWMHSTGCCGKSNTLNPPKRLSNKKLINIHNQGFPEGFHHGPCIGCLNTTVVTTLPQWVN